MTETNKYQKGKIYKIVCNVTGLVYVGSTIEPTLSKRLTKHRCAYKKYKEGVRNYISVFKVMENNNYYIELLNKAPCDSKDELFAIEGQYIRDLDCVNMRIAGRKWKEYYKDNKQNIIKKVKDYKEKNKEKNKDKIKEHSITYRAINKEVIQKSNQEYYDKNKDKIKENVKKYREKNKDKIKEYREINKDKNKDKIKEYREKNKDKINEQNKEYREKNKESNKQRCKNYYENNKDVINKKRLEKQTCICGSIHSLAYKSSHLQSNKHQAFLDITKI